MLFGGWDFEPEDAQARYIARVGYGKGVPMVNVQRKQLLLYSGQFDHLILFSDKAKSDVEFYFLKWIYHN